MFAGSRGVGSQIIMNLLLQGNNKAKLVAINEPSILVENMVSKIDPLGSIFILGLPDYRNFGFFLVI